MSGAAVEAGTADVRGARLYYEVAGDGSAVVLIHAGIADSGMWDEQFEQFAARHRTLRYDVRGYGRSTLPGGPYSNVGDLRELLGQLGIERAALVGASMGGRIALELALVEPSVATALVLVGSGLDDHEWSPDVERFGEAEEELLERGDIDGAVELNVDLWVAGPGRTLAEVDPGVVERVREMQRTAFETQVSAYGEEPPPGPGEALDPPAGSRLGDISVPTLVLVGALDVGDIHAISDRFASGIPGARKVVIEGTAHVPNMERPAEFNRLVLDFLAEVESGERRR